MWAPLISGSNRALTPQQLAWQPYRKDVVLRFGHAQDAYVRTYKVKSVKSRFRKDGSFPGRYEELTVTIQRTDSAAKPFDALALELFASDEQEGEPTIKAYCGWDEYGGGMPIEKILNGAAQTKEYTRSTMGQIGSSEITVVAYESAELVPSLMLGGKAYEQVVRIDNLLEPLKQPLKNTFRHLYYARQLGVVGFEAARGGEWYRVN